MAGFPATGVGAGRIPFPPQNEANRNVFKVSMIYGFAYLGMVLAISAGWVLLAVLKKPDFIEKPLNELKNKIRPFLNPKKEQ